MGLRLMQELCSLIFFAPDHVRTWKREVYKEVGGHNVNRSILDDQELMIKNLYDHEVLSYS